MPIAQYWGSANSGLGFFHTEVEDKNESDWDNFGNVCTFVVEGVISEQELRKCFV